ncbi:MAG: hypothetical protein ACYC35_07875 [Pirellulales bacterium]
MKKILSSCLVLGLLVGLSLPAVAQTNSLPAAAQASSPSGTKAVVVVSISGYDELFADLEYVGKVSDNPDLAKGLEGFLNLFTQNKGLAGLDKKRPAGLVVSVDDSGMQFDGVGFVPVTDAKALLDALAPIIGAAEDAKDGVQKIQKDGQSVFIKVQGPWVFLAQKPESLAKLPADPAKDLAGLDKQYDIAVRANVQNIPEMFRQMAVSALKIGAAQAMAKQPNEDDSQYELRKKLSQNSINQMITGIQEIDQVTLGWSLDRTAQKTFLDVSVTAVKDSSTAKKFAQVKEVTTKYSGFQLPGAAVTLLAAGQMSPEDIDQAGAMIKVIRAKADKELSADPSLADPKDKAAAKELLADVMSVLEATVKTGRMDGGLVVLADDKNLSLVAGGAIADDKTLEKALQSVVKLAEKEPGFPAVKFNAEEYKGVRFHTTSVPLPPDQDTEKLAKILGGKLDVVVGLGNQSVYVAIGKDCAATLKKVLDRSAGNPFEVPVPPMQLSVALSPIFKFAGTIGEADPMIAMLSGSLAKAEGKDHITLTAKAAPNGVTYRLEAEEGIIKLIGQAGKMAVPSGAGM